MTSVPVSVGIGAYLHQSVSLGAFFYYMPHLVAVPFLIRLLNHALATWPGSKHVKEMLLLKNGQQVLLKTIDGVWHKICIQDIEDYKMVDKKSHMQILIKNNGRNFTMSTKNKKFINFELIDKIIKGVCIETGTSKSRARPPMNLVQESIVEVDPLRVLAAVRTKQVRQVDENQVDGRTKGRKFNSANFVRSVQKALQERIKKPKYESKMRNI